MLVIEKKNQIEMKLKKETTNIQQLRAAANRSSALAGDVCNVLGACEQRLQQLESAVLPLYGDTARLQQIHNNMERTVKALDNVINYYMMTRDLADLIQAGPYTTTPESLNIYLEALDKLAEAQEYFNKNNPQSVELVNINQLYNSGVSKLESAFEDMLSRSTRPLSPPTIIEMIALDDDSSADSVSVSNSNSSASTSGEVVRSAAGWLCSAGRPPASAVLMVRGNALRLSLTSFRDYLKSRTMGASPLMRTKNSLNRSDSTAKKTSKIQKVLEKRANKIMMRASQTLENSTGLAIGPRRSIVDSGWDQTSTSEAESEMEAEIVASLAEAISKIAKAEQRQLVGLVGLAKLPALITALLKDCMSILNTDLERVCNRFRRQASKCIAVCACCWALCARVQRAANAAPRGTFAQIVAKLQHTCVGVSDDWVECIRSDGARGSVDGTVHQLTSACHAYLLALAPLASTLGPILGAEASYARAAGQIGAANDKDALVLAIYMRKVLAQLNLALVNKSTQYPDALKAIFLLNNTLYLLQGLQRSGLLGVLMLAEPDCENNYRDMIQEHKNAYLNSWTKLMSHLVLDEALPAKLRDRDRQILKDKFASFNREWEECTKCQRGYSVPDPELREALKRDNKETILPSYTRFYDTYAEMPFSKNPDKYVKYSPLQIATQLDGYFDESA